MKRRLEQIEDPLFNSGASPILQSREQLIAATDSDSDDEIIFTTQANKKRKMSADDAMKLWISNEFKKQLAHLATRDQMENIVSSVDRNTALSQANAAALARQQQELNDIRCAIDPGRPSTSKTLLPSTSNLLSYAGTATMSPRKSQPALQRSVMIRAERAELERKNYEKARRSIRVWPIAGANKEEMMDSLKDFCMNALLLGDSNLGVIGIDRARSSPRGRAYLETVVEFEDADSRDRVFSCGPRLSGYRDKDDRPTCGLRLQIPGHLMTQFRTLEAFAYSHRNRHNGNVKKHIKFDDSNYGLYVQLKHSRDDEWTNFSFETAKAEQEKNNAGRAKRSHLFKSPERESEEKNGKEDGKEKATEGSRQREQTGSFVPPPRTNANQPNSEKGSWRPPRDQDTEMV